MGLPLLPDDAEDPYVFRMDLEEFGTRVVFDRGAGEATTRLHLDLMPLTLDKRSGSSNPRRWLVGALGAVAVATTARAVRRRTPSVCDRSSVVAVERVRGVERFLQHGDVDFLT
jgi:hypothetical protein